MRLCELEGQPVQLTRTAFTLLLAIMLGEGRVLSKDSLALEVRVDHDGDYVSKADQGVVESHLAHLRRRLGDPVDSPLHRDGPGHGIPAGRSARRTSGTTWLIRGSAA